MMYKEGDQVLIKATVRAIKADGVNVVLYDSDGDSWTITMNPEDVHEDTEPTLEGTGQTFKNPRVLIFNGSAEVTEGPRAAGIAIDKARRLATEDKQTRTVLVVPAQSIDNALSFVDVGVRQVKHSELIEEAARLGLENQ